MINNKLSTTKQFGSMNEHSGHGDYVSGDVV